MALFAELSRNLDESNGRTDTGRQQQCLGNEAVKDGGGPFEVEDKTRTVVRLFAHGSSFVSRSEAKRLLHGLEHFREVVLDFAGVDIVGQGFTDEVFRVWARAHSETRLVPVDMTEPVEFMVRRALAGG